MNLRERSLVQGDLRALSLIPRRSGLQALTAPRNLFS
jgi:hypothetical protein